MGLGGFSLYLIRKMLLWNSGTCGHSSGWTWFFNDRCMCTQPLGLLVSLCLYLSVSFCLSVSLSMFHENTGTDMDFPPMIIIYYVIFLVFF